MTLVTSKPSVKIVKQFTYRGGSGKQWSNRYFFGPDTPATSSDRYALSDAIVAGEKTMHPSYVQIVEAVFYAAGSELPIDSKVYTTNGTLTITGTNPTPGDAAHVIRYSTDQRTSKNHPIYLFNYYHGVRIDTAGDNDTVASAQHSAAATYAGNWVSGGWVAGKSYKRCGPHGAVAQGAVALPEVTHRDFPR